MKVDVDKIWEQNEFGLQTNKSVEIISTLYFDKYEHSSDIEEQLEDWSLDDLINTFELVSEMFTYEVGEYEENEFAEPEVYQLAHEFYNAANISDATNYYLRPKSKKKFF